MTKKGSLFTKLLFLFFGAGISIILAIALSFHFLSDKPHKKHLKRHLRAYVELLIDKENDQQQFQDILTKTDLVYYKVPRAEEKQFEKSKWPRHSFEFKNKKFVISRNHKPFVLRLRKKGMSYYFHPGPKNPPMWNNWLPILTGLGLSILILMLTYHMVQKLLRPIKEIETGAKNFGLGNLDYDIPSHGNTELTRLAESINILRDNIKGMLESKSELMLAIAHELKTPLSRMRLDIELLDDQSRKRSLTEEIKEMNDIIDGLLESERLNRNNSLNLENITLSDFFDDFEQSRVKVNLSNSLAKCSFDPLRIKLAINNLINNALKYTEGEILLEVNNDEKLLSIIVQDQGPGVPEGELKRLTEAFYRPESHRDRKTGGVGLGLYLVSQIANAHHGELKLENENGLKASISIPIK